MERRKCLFICGKKCPSALPRGDVEHDDGDEEYSRPPRDTSTSHRDTITPAGGLLLMDGCCERQVVSFAEPVVNSADP